MGWRRTSSNDHGDAHLMGAEVQHDGDTCEVVGLQGRWATVRRQDGHESTVAIVDIENQ